MVLDGLLIVRKVVKVIFGKEKGNLRLTDRNRKVDYLELRKGKKAVRFWRVEGLG